MLSDEDQQTPARIEEEAQGVDYKATGKVVYDEFDQKPSKSIVDKIDAVLAQHYGFTDEELDFIINVANQSHRLFIKYMDYALLCYRWSTGTRWAPSGP